MCDCNCKRGLRGYEGISAYQVAVQEGFVGTEQEWLDSLVGSELPLDWEDLTPFLDSNWANLGAATPKYAIDTVKKLIYLSGNISNTTTASSDDVCFTITGLTGTPPSSKSMCYDDENSKVVGVNLLSGLNTFRFQYLGSDTHARLTLDSVPAIRLF